MFPQAVLSGVGVVALNNMKQFII